eukprot:scaffold14488_cov131-Isochrysis_galbana.AAC.2
MNQPLSPRWMLSVCAGIPPIRASPVHAAHRARMPCGVYMQPRMCMRMLPARCRSPLFMQWNIARVGPTATGAISGRSMGAPIQQGWARRWRQVKNHFQKKILNRKRYTLAATRRTTLSDLCRPITPPPPSHSFPIPVPSSGRLLRGDGVRAACATTDNSLGLGIESLGFSI